MLGGLGGDSVEIMPWLHNETQLRAAERSFGCASAICPEKI